MINVLHTKLDSWILFELIEGEILSKVLWEQVGDFYNGERIYKIVHN